MININLVIDSKPYKVTTIFSMYVVCRKIGALWTAKTLEITNDFWEFKKEKDVLFSSDLREDEAINLLNEVNLSKDLADFTLFELVQLNSAIGSLFKIECSKIDGADPNLLGSIEGVMYACATILKVTNGLPVEEAIATAISEAKCHIPSGQEYIDIVEKIIDMPVFFNRNISETAHKIFDPIIKLCKGGYQIC